MAKHVVTELDYSTRALQPSPEVVALVQGPPVLREALGIRERLPVCARRHRLREVEGAAVLLLLKATIAVQQLRRLLLRELFLCGDWPVRSGCRRGWVSAGIVDIAADAAATPVQPPHPRRRILIAVVCDCGIIEKPFEKGRS